MEFRIRFYVVLDHALVIQTPASEDVRSAVFWLGGKEQVRVPPRERWKDFFEPCLTTGCIASTEVPFEEVENMKRNNSNRINRIQ